jgi:ribosomal protein S18 acetylase RimI-like enzyme
MIEFVPFDHAFHTEVYRQLNIEHLTWAMDQLRATYQYDATSETGQTIPEYVDEHLGDLTRLHPPDGIIYLLRVDGDILGMGALRKLSDTAGEIKRMYIRPAIRGRGYGNQLLEQLLSTGRAFGCSTFLLDTPKFATAAQHIYRAAGFTERTEYPESEVPAAFHPY